MRVLAPMTVVCLLTTVSPRSLAQDPEQLSIADRVGALFADECTRCHGPRKQRSGLRLDSRSALLAGGARGPAVVPGDPDASLLMTAVHYEDEDLVMPPKGKLADHEIELLAEWIRAGAPASSTVSAEADANAAESEAEEVFDLSERADHWAFQPLRAPLPDASIDRFVDDRLEQQGLVAAAQADRRTLLRRLSFDLTGLPPEPGWLAARMEIPLDAVVDELLDSPRFGERWARHWLDLVRYAEGRGHEYDHDIPNAYQYRDWVVRAFNADVPYDRFVMEHIAGDLLPEPRLDPETGANESVLGTGFWFLGPEVHSPVDIRGDETDRTANKVDVLSRAFLGLTVACARCHDHKFDAISTEDFYALSGFALSGGYSQVRFETIEHNSRIARELAALEEEQESDLRQSLGAYLEGQALQVQEHLDAAATVAFGERDRSDGIGDTGSGDPASIWFEELDLLFEDFERSEYDPWTASGTAFGNGPRTREDFADYHDVRGQRGERAVNSHNTASGEDVAAGDAHVGILTSPPFQIERDWIHFLIGGGKGEDTAVQLEIGGEIVASAHGQDSNEMNPAAFDVRPWLGRTARIVIRDGESGGWGNIGVDHIVFSDREDARALEMDLPPREAALRAQRIDEQAREFGLNHGAVSASATELQTAVDREDHLLHPFAFLASTASELDAATRDRQFEYVFEALAARSSPKDDDRWSSIADFGNIDQADLFQNGFGFRRRATGDLLHLPGGMDVALEDGVYWDPAWDVLEPHGETQVESEHAVVDWETSGRMLRTPNVTLETGNLRYLVRGSGKAFAVVDDHRMVRGPLHTETVLTIDTPGAGFSWIEHDLSAYAGHRVAIEFSPARQGEGPGELAIARIVENAPPFNETDSSHQGEPTASAEWIAALRESGTDLPDLSLHYEELCRTAARRLRNGEALTRVDARLLSWLAGRTDPASHIPEPLAAGRAELLDQILRVSRTAPAMLAGSGIDEFVLVRGNSKTPGDVVPRRFLEVFDGPDALIPGGGTGRLELADRLVDPNLPLLARVWANRLWQHLTGLGIVRSVDDFGRMGMPPSHPELLDHLARRLIDSGWSTKTLVREIVSSAAYRRTSVPSPQSLEIDPENIFLSSARRRRLDGEAIRDAMLSTSGGLDPALGGPPVPLHLTDFMEGRGRPGIDGPIDGEGRRSLYLAVRRNFPQPFLQAFDFPPPATTIGCRSVSNVPAQSLTLLNDPFVLGEARRWSERILEDPDLGPGERIGQMYLTALGREPDEVELEAAQAFIHGRCAEYLAGSEGDGLGARDPRAWTALAHVLFNLKEFIYLD